MDVAKVYKVMWNIVQLKSGPQIESKSHSLRRRHPVIFGGAPCLQDRLSGQRFRDGAETARERLVKGGPRRCSPPRLPRADGRRVACRKVVSTSSCLSTPTNCTTRHRRYHPRSVGICLLGSTRYGRDSHLGRLGLPKRQDWDRLLQRCRRHDPLVQSHQVRSRAPTFELTRQHGSIRWHHRVPYPNSRSPHRRHLHDGEPQSDLELPPLILSSSTPSRT